MMDRINFIGLTACCLQVEEQPLVEGTEEEQQPSEDEQVRQRVGMSRPMPPSEMQPQPQPQHATIGIVSSTSDSYKNWLMWFLVAAIIVLIYRRLFLM
jgi:hypothetical protein